MKPITQQLPYQAELPVLWFRLVATSLDGKKGVRSASSAPPDKPWDESQKMHSKFVFFPVLTAFAPLPMASRPRRISGFPLSDDRREEFGKSARRGRRPSTQFVPRTMRTTKSLRIHLHASVKSPGIECWVPSAGAGPFLLLFWAQQKRRAWFSLEN